MQVKPFVASRGAVGSAMAAVFTLLAAFGIDLGITAEETAEVVWQVLAVISAIIALWGRVSATTRIRGFFTSTTPGLVFLLVSLLVLSACAVQIREEEGGQTPKVKMTAVGLFMRAEMKDVCSLFNADGTPLAQRTVTSRAEGDEISIGAGERLANRAIGLLGARAGVAGADEGAGDGSEEEGAGGGEAPGAVFPQLAACGPYYVPQQPPQPVKALQATDIPTS